MAESIPVQANGLRFHVLAEGEGDELALCLHGFPELAHSYRHQLPLLASLGYRAWAPDLRGYGGTDRPAEMQDYATRLRSMTAGEGTFTMRESHFEAAPHNVQAHVIAEREASVV